MDINLLKAYGNIITFLQNNITLSISDRIIFAASFTSKKNNTMKNALKFKKALFVITTITAGFGIQSCNNSPKVEDSKEIAEENNEEKFDKKAQEKDAQFLVDAAEINLEEIQLGQLAQSTSKNADVIALGKMMEEAHTKAWKELESLAAKKQVSIPTTSTEKGQDEYKKLSEKTGKDFDKEYCDMMVKGHKKAIDKFEKASKDAEDADIKTWASSMLPELNKHLEHSKTCEEKMKKM
jgi:putative membrane protein